MIKARTLIARKLATLAGIAGLLCIGNANATLDSPLFGDFGLLTAPQSVTFAGHESFGGMTTFDEILFSVTNTSGVESNTAVISSQIGGNGYQSFSASLWDSSDTILLADGPGSELMFGGSGIWTAAFSFAPLTVENSPYHIHVTGITLPTSNIATYAGSMTISPLSVTEAPEPGTYAMMLAGLGLLGFSVRRRSR